MATVWQTTDPRLSHAYAYAYIRPVLVPQLYAVSYMPHKGLLMPSGLNDLTTRAGCP
jgi:hypothetical protein